MHQKSPGPKTKVTTVDLNNFYAYAETIKGRSSTLNQVKKACKLPYSLSRISQTLVKRGLKCRIHVKKPLLQPHHISAILTFAKDNEQRDWRTVVFSDEKTVQNFFNGKKFIRRRHGEELNSEDQFLSVPNRKVKVNFWGFIAIDSWGLFLLPDKATGEDYIKTLETGFLPTIREKMQNFTFMQNGASFYSPAKSFLNENKIDFLNCQQNPPISIQLKMSGD